MGDTFFQIFLALLGIVIGILSQLVKPQTQRWMLLIFGFLLFLSAGLWAGFNLATKDLRPLPSPTNEAFKLAGIWEGTNSQGMLFRLTFGQSCNIGDVCGKVELPSVGCTAFPVLASTDGKTFIFQETSHQGCLTATGNDTIQIMPDGTLLYGSNGLPPTIVLIRQ